MNNDEEDLLTRDLAVQKVLQDNATLYSTLPALIAAFTDLKAGVTGIQTYKQEQEKDKKGITGNKENIEAAMIKAALKVKAGIIAYASAINDSVLKKKVDFSKSELERCRDTVRYDRCRLIYETGLPLATQIATYFVTAADLTNLNTQVANYLIAIPQPRTAIVLGGNSTIQMKILFEITESIQKDRIDGMMGPFEFTKPDFFNAYVGARKVVKHGRHSVSITGKVVEKKNGNAVSKATVVNDETEIKTTTTQRGGFKVLSLLTGKYELTVTKKGFVKTTFIVAVKEGETTHVTLEIEKG